MQLKLNKIKPNPANPRIIRDEQFKKLKASLIEFPQMLEKRPIAVTRDGDGYVALGGNQRLRAMLDIQSEIGDVDFEKRHKVQAAEMEALLGYFAKGVPVVDCTELTPAQQKRFIIADNIPFGEWDWEALANEWDVEELQDWGMQIPNLSFDGLEVEEEQKSAEEDDFEVPDEIQTDIVLGDLFEIGPHRLLCGDSMNENDLKKLMKGEKANMVFTDPPYDLEKEEYHDSIYNNIENAHVFLMHDDKGIVNYLRNSKLEFLRFFVANFIFSSPRGNDPYLNHILVSQEKKGKAIAHKNMHDGLSSIIKMEYRGFLKDDKTVHKHQKSIKFISIFIEHFSNTEHTLLDIFLGSGSTMVAAHQLGRKCYGLELDPKYCQVILDRMLSLDPSLKVVRNGKVYN